ncbi:MAG: bifunctional 23S rRNA (guanine(2069)-N(7))-methyltransferase RlmK/23S rRNA (guanine(2445)-N(2))-methyltransferase RlmL [Gammaproteobacteria bacterium]|jgi:23S rRNA (guanine2445-N2)-methyltransferase / 23S rRNA (guanine2069-N7)-methyltransferase|nr:bifunctional 23S rRNA (guanine(2069)-N(7))-methyltransferase RlmK/23S rRNA (guanine(2445)-N(2))-methyltransferase RlmL [Gammaproteobacteria bacterium]MBT3725833.1 bifunctional 23S rRNA (guanine(2069)-N(7))-methyltransferase RlmK/23S rRNA (guanine(2445)-N(2))-methyltransferase RlmL [Gammaproteobacteria bacterium]MBT4078191.1 bifunctional 23S rRNA (guanine(2069)-N(7))-methyltransferase RlmK/23S rRNA (guanine(2445)-N(2))-methyltransferase RlmL [Gammaproteobacteria bacterium]MBT4195712.1 bifuncti
MITSYNFFVTGHKGFETALFHEIREIYSRVDDDSKQIKKVYGGIELKGSIELAYRICIYSRLANRVYMPIKTFRADTEEALYQGVYDVDWSSHLSSRHSLAVSATLSRSDINHSHYASLKVKDAVVDYFRNTVNSRPVIEKQRPDLHIHLNIHKNNATLSLDLSGQSLHLRGYRLQHSGAPLKENLAAALLAQAGWNRETAKTHSLIDPMCGSGTFAIEAAMVVANIPPGLDREYFGFLRWLQHDKKCWESCLAEAEDGIDEQADCEIFSSDSSERAIEISKDNAMRAGVEELIHFKKMDMESLKPDCVTKPPIIIFNPPYGERLQAEQGLGNLYTQMGKVLSEFKNSSVHIISANPDLLHRLRLNRTAKKSVNNGQIQCVFASFEIAEQQQASQPEAEEIKQPPAILPAVDSNDPEANALKNRLIKNTKHISRWAKRKDVSCYRLYDADLPEFAFSLDKYTNALNPDQAWYHLSEYQAPKTIEPETAEKRIKLAQSVVKKVFNLSDSELFCKLRQRQRGKLQYEKQDKQGELFQVKEGNARLLVNLTDYLDTGLFLDHRDTRQMVSTLATDKKVLNLFCYTGSVSVQAALGGASQVISTDMSGTYINWAKENFELNDLKDENKYKFIQADCVDLLERPEAYDLGDKFDLIFLDPPSFSNSKKMHDTLDILRDHEELITQSMALLYKKGKLIFSTNKKGFKLSSSLLKQFDITDITHQTIPEDFKRRPKIHQCWQIKH